MKSSLKSKIKLKYYNLLYWAFLIIIFKISISFFFNRGIPHPHQGFVFKIYIVLFQWMDNGTCHKTLSIEFEFHLLFYLNLFNCFTLQYTSTVKFSVKQIPWNSNKAGEFKNDNNLQLSTNKQAMLFTKKMFSLENRHSCEQTIFHKKRSSKNHYIHEKKSKKQKIRNWDIFLKSGRGNNWP